MKKPEIDFDPNLLQLFRVSYNVNESKVKQFQLLSKDKTAIMEFKDKFIIAF